MTFNRETFFDRFKKFFDPTLEQSQVDGIEFLLGEFEKDEHWTNVKDIAYALATVYHETAGSMQPVEEGYYLGTGAKAFQKKLRYFPFFGRGYVQLTWRKNYEKAGEALGIDLVSDPDLALKPAFAFQTMTLGMFRGWFTGKKLSDYINGHSTDYVEARRIINGTDRAGLIAGYARHFESILRDSAAAPADDTPQVRSDSQVNQSSTNAGSGTTSKPSPSTTPPSDVVPVPQAKPAEIVPEEGMIARIKSIYLAAPAAVGTFLTGVGTWLSGARLEITLGFFGASALIAMTWISWAFYIKNQREKRTQELTKLREAQAFELTKIQMESAMRKDLNTVQLMPPVVETSEPTPKSEE